MKAFVVLLLAGNFLLCQSGSIQRNKRGYLSRTGLCAKPEENFHIKDPRLNFWGVAYVLPDDANPKCTESECSEDSHCDADRKCCKNYCGGKVCTPTTRDPNPCKKFKCPTGQTCKIQYVPCVMPKCQDAVAVNRPTCIKDPAAPAPAAPASPLSAPNPAGPETTPYGPANPAMYPQQPSPYQPQQQYAPAPFAPPMPPMGPMAGFQNDEPGAGSEAGFQGGLGGEQPNFDTAFNDAPALGASMQNENQPLTFQNESPLTSEPSNFFQPPAEEQQPLATEPVSQLSADMYAPRRAWDRSSKSHGQ